MAPQKGCHVLIIELWGRLKVWLVVKCQQALRSRPVFDLFLPRLLMGRDVDPEIQPSVDEIIIS